MRLIPLILLGAITMSVHAQSPPPYMGAASAPPSSFQEPYSPSAPGARPTIAPDQLAKPMVFSSSWKDVLSLTGSWTGHDSAAPSQRALSAPTNQPLASSSTLSGRIALDRFFPAGSRVKLPLTFGWEQNAMTRRTNMFDAHSARTFSDRRAFSAATRIEFSPLSTMQLSYRRGTESAGDLVSTRRRTTNLTGGFNHTWKAPQQIGSFTTAGKLVVEIGGAVSSDWNDAADASTGGERTTSQKGRAAFTLRPFSGLSLSYSLDIAKRDARVGAARSVGSSDCSHSFAATLAVPERRGIAAGLSMAGDLSEVRDMRRNATNRNIRSEAKFNLDVDPAKWSPGLSFFTAKFTSSIADQTRSTSPSDGWAATADEASRLAGFLGFARQSRQAGGATLIRHAVTGDLRSIRALQTSYSASYSHDGSGRGGQGLARIQSQLNISDLTFHSQGAWGAASVLTGSFQAAEDRGASRASATLTSSLGCRTVWTPRLKTAIQIDGNRSILHSGGSSAGATSLVVAVSGDADFDLRLPALTPQTVRVVGTGSFSSNFSWNAAVPAGVPPDASRTPKDAYTLRLGMSCPSVAGMDLAASSSCHFSREARAVASSSFRWEGQLSGKLSF
jgi:hypothetical protein